MIRSDLDWPFIRQNMLIPAATTVVAALALAAAYWVHEDQVQRYAQLSGSHAAIHEDYDALIAQKRLVDLYHRRYLQFNDLGFVGRESRLDWVVSLRRATRDLTLPRVSYAIEPQLQVVAPLPSASAGDSVQIFQSSMRVEMALLHELDLLRFVDELQSKAPGLIKIDGCELAWQVDEGRQTLAAANIHAACDVKIFSLITSDVVTEGVL